MTSYIKVVGWFGDTGMSDVSFLLPVVVGTIIIVATILFGVSICCGKYWQVDVSN